MVVQYSARILPTRNGNYRQPSGCSVMLRGTDPTYKEWKHCAAGRLPPAGALHGSYLQGMETGQSFLALPSLR